MCTVLLRLAPGSLEFGAVRDEFVDRTWDPPDAYWGGGLLGGRDRSAGGTWLAVDPVQCAVAAILNGVRRPLPPDLVRPSRGGLPIAALRGEPLPEPAMLDRYDGFHLVLGTADGVRVWSWDGGELAYRELDAGEHVIVNAGVDLADPLVAQRFRQERDWRLLLADDAVLLDREYAGRRYGSTSTALVTVGRQAPPCWSGPSASPRAGLRYEFNPRPRDTSAWYRVWPG
jgi:uncharacterized protein with NRDE domain